FIPSQPLADCLSHGNAEPLSIAHDLSVLKLAVVIAERLLVDVPEEMKWFHAHISTAETPLQETPEVFHPVSVNVAANVLLCVVDDLMNKLLIKSPVRYEFIGEDVRSSLDA